LRLQKPFVYLVIMLVASFENIPRQIKLGDETMRYLGEHVLVRGQKTLDLLQGMLLYCSWFVHLLHYLAMNFDQHHHLKNA
jgi:hypothetical protein